MQDTHMHAGLFSLHVLWSHHVCCWQGQPFHQWKETRSFLWYFPSFTSFLNLDHLSIPASIISLELILLASNRHQTPKKRAAANIHKVLDPHGAIREVVQDEGNSQDGQLGHSHWLFCRVLGLFDLGRLGTSTAISLSLFDLRMYIVVSSNLINIIFSGFWEDD